ncbi:hypothetical protein HGA88_04840 [Candidatus Roizmanbacteria bacterium]|nr:hypothetical protein [Candidatus Roizmanbacteria bacterium]
MSFPESHVPTRYLSFDGPKPVGLDITDTISFDKESMFDILFSLSLSTTGVKRENPLNIGASLMVNINPDKSFRLYYAAQQTSSSPENKGRSPNSLSCAINSHGLYVYYPNLTAQVLFWQSDNNSYDMQSVIIDLFTENVMLLQLGKTQQVGNEWYQFTNSEEMNTITRVQCMQDDYIRTGVRFHSKTVFSIIHQLRLVEDYATSANLDKNNLYNMMNWVNDYLVQAEKQNNFIRFFPFG